MRYEFRVVVELRLVILRVATAYGHCVGIRAPEEHESCIFRVASFSETCVTAFMSTR